MVEIGKHIRSTSEPHGGYGAGAGSIDTDIYECPCGKGTYRAVRDNIPGFRDKDYYLECSECLENYNFDSVTGAITEKE